MHLQADIIRKSVHYAVVDSVKADERLMPVLLLRGPNARQSRKALVPDPELLQQLCGPCLRQTLGGLVSGSPGAASQHQAGCHGQVFCSSAQSATWSMMSKAHHYSVHFQESGVSVFQVSPNKHAITCICTTNPRQGIWKGQTGNGPFHSADHEVLGGVLPRDKLKHAGLVSGGLQEAGAEGIRDKLSLPLRKDPVPQHILQKAPSEAVSGDGGALPRMIRPHWVSSHHQPGGT